MKRITCCEDIKKPFIKQSFLEYQTQKNITKKTAEVGGRGRDKNRTAK